MEWLISFARDWLFHVMLLLGVTLSAWFGAYLERNKPKLSKNQLWLYLLAFGVGYAIFVRLIEMVR